MLQRLEAIETSGHVTAAGRRMAALGTHPRLAHMIDRGATLGLGDLACELAALLAERDPLRTQGGAPRDPDLRHRIDVLHGGTAPPGTTIDSRALQQVRRTADLLRRRTPRSSVGSGHPTLVPDRDLAAGLLLAFAYPDRIGLTRGAESGRYLLSQGRGAVLPGPSALARSEFIVAADLDAGAREAKLYLAAPLTRELLERHFDARIETRDEVAWDPRAEAVVARRVRRLDQLVLEERPLTRAVEEPARAAMVAGIRALGLQCLPWTSELGQWRARLTFLHVTATTSAERAQWPDVSDAALLDTLEIWLGPWLDGVTRREHLARIDLRAALHGLLDWNHQRRLDELAPTHLVVPSGSRIALDYSGDAPVAGCATAGGLRLDGDSSHRRRSRAGDAGTAVAGPATGAGHARPRELLGAGVRRGPQGTQGTLSEALLARGPLRCDGDPQGAASATLIFEGCERTQVAAVGCLNDDASRRTERDARERALAASRSCLADPLRVRDARDRVCAVPAGPAVRPGRTRGPTDVGAGSGHRARSAGADRRALPVGWQ